MGVYLGVYYLIWKFGVLKVVYLLSIKHFVQLFNVGGWIFESFVLID